MDNYFETIQKIRQDLLSTVVCRPTFADNRWYIQGKWHDSEGRVHTTVIYTFDRPLATEWRNYPDNSDLMNSFRKTWAQMLLGHILYRYEI